MSVGEFPCRISLLGWVQCPSSESGGPFGDTWSFLFSFLLQFISGILAALSAMISLEIPQVNIMTKMDLLSKKAKKEIEK